MHVRLSGQQQSQREIGCVRNNVRMPVVAILSIVSLLMLWAHSATAEPRSVRVGVYDNVPLTYISKTGKATGLTVEMLRKISQHERWDLEFISCAWQDCLAMLTDGRIDLQVGIISTAKRQETFTFTDTFVFNLWGQVYTTPGRPFETILDLEGRRVGLYEGSVPAEAFLHLIERFGVKPEIVFRSDYHELATLLQDGQVDAAIFIRSFAAYYDDEYELRRTPIIFSPLPLRYATAKGRNLDVLKAIDTHLEKWKEDAHSPYYEVLTATFGDQAVKTETPPYIYLIIIFLGLFTITIALFNSLLRRQVTAKTKQLHQEVAIKDEIAEKLIENTERLQKSERQYRKLFSSAEVSIWNEDLSGVYKALEQFRKEGIQDLRAHLNAHEHEAWKLAGMVKVLEVNPTTLKLFRASSQDNFIRSIEKTFGDNAIEVFIDELCAIWDGRDFFQSEANFRTLDGTVINAIISFRMPQSPKGFESLPISITDITEQKQAEQGLRDSERRLSTLMRNLPGMAYRCNFDDFYTMLFVSGGCEPLTGFKSDELRENKVISYFDLIISDDRKFVRAEVARAVAENHPFELTYRIRKQDGAVRWVWEKGRCVHTPETGPAILEGFIADITDRKLTEQALLRTQQIVEQSPVTTILTTLDGTITYTNPATQNLTGYDQDELLGQSPKLLNSGNHSEALYQNLWSTITKGRIWTGELCNKRKDGSLYWAATVISPLIEDDQHIGYIGLSTDITDSKRAEQQLRSAQKMEVVGQLSGGIAHDFNNVLGVILGNLELLRRRVGEDDTALKYIQAALQGTTRGTDLTKKILGFSRNKTEANQTIQVNDFITDMDNLIAKSLTPKIAIKTYLSDDVWNVDIDPGDFQDALLNLALNARDAMPHGGTLTIETENKHFDDHNAQDNPSFKAGDYVMICISDTGEGMSSDTIEHIFEPFFSTKPEGKGTGLGLSMAYGFVQRSGGYIKVYSEPGKGSTFRMFLPRTITDTGNDPKSPTDNSSDLPGGTETILIVDDEEDLVHVSVNLLADLGYKLITATSAQQALDFLQNQTPVDLLFTDVIMPGDMDGLNLSREVLKTYPEIKILITSGFTSKKLSTIAGDEDQLQKLAKNLLSKPYSQAELAKAVRQALDE